MSDPLDPTVMAAMPVTVPHQDRVLVRHADAFVAVTGARAYPQSVMFQMLIKVRSLVGEQPNIAFGFPRLHKPGNLEFGAEALGTDRAWRPAPANFAGGGGGGDPASGVGNYEFKWWLPLTTEQQGLRLWCQWPERGITRATAELDLEPILNASRESQPAWPA